MLLLAELSWIDVAGLAASLVAITTAIWGTTVWFERRIGTRLGAVDAKVPAGKPEHAYTRPTIPWKPTEETQELGPADILAWDYRVVSRIMGRRSEIEKIEAWLAAQEQQPLSVLLVTGAGGSGKTRLAAEAAESVRSKRGLGRPWRTVGFLSDAMKLKTPALLIVDDSDASQKKIIELLEEIYAREDISQRVCVLLICREESIQSWRAALRESNIARFVERSKIEVPALSENDAWNLFKEAVERIAGVFRKDAPQTTLEQFVEWLHRDPAINGLPAYTMAAAAQAVADPQKPLGSTGHAIMDREATEELERINRSAAYLHSFPEAGRKEVAGRLAALAAIRGRLLPKDLERLASSDLGISLPDKNQILDAVRQLPWWRNGEWPAPRPRIVGNLIAWKIIESITEGGSNNLEEKAADFLFAAIDPAGDPTFDYDVIVERLGRLVYDIDDIYGNECAKTFVKYLAGMVSSEDRAQSLHFFTNYEAPVGLSALAVRVAHRQVGKLRRLSALDPVRYEPVLAKALNTLCNHLGDVSLTQEALRAGDEAVTIYRRLVKRDPVRFENELAMSLTNLSIALSDTGQSQDALNAIKEAVQLRRRLAARDDKYDTDLACSVSNLGSCLANVGRTQDAIEADREALVIYRRLAERDFGRFAAEVAAGLHNLSILLGKARQRDEALSASEESVSIYRRLSETEPWRFELDLADGINTLGPLLADLGRHQDALGAKEEAVSIYRRLSRLEPSRLGPKLANGLNNLAISLSRRSRNVEALDAADEAVAITRMLAKQQPMTFEPDLAASLNNQGRCLAAVKRVEEALAVTEESVAIRERLAAQEPERFKPGLASGLANFASRLSAAGRSQDALGARERAVALYRSLAQRDEARFKLLLADNLHGLSTLLAKLGNGDEALR